MNLFLNPLSKRAQQNSWHMWKRMKSNCDGVSFLISCCLMLKQQSEVSELPATWRQSTDLWTTSDVTYHIWGAQFLGRRLGRQGLLLHALRLDHSGELGPWLLGHQLDWRLQGGCSQEEVNGHVTGPSEMAPGWQSEGWPLWMAGPQPLAIGHVEGPGFRPKGAGRRPSRSWKAGTSACTVQVPNWHQSQKRVALSRWWDGRRWRRHGFWSEGWKSKG